MPAKLTVRLRDDNIILRLGLEEYELEVRDGICDDAAHLARTIQGRIAEVLDKRRRANLQFIKDNQQPWKGMPDEKSSGH
jgi:hypothetical protein